MLFAVVGCGSVDHHERRHCRPAPGMTTEQLAACGCVLLDNGSLASAPAALSEDGSAVRSVIIVNYICPLGEAGVAKVSVRNGVADSVLF
jgi:hypothetical protein